MRAYLAIVVLLALWLAGCNAAADYRSFGETGAGSAPMNELNRRMGKEVIGLNAPAYAIAEGDFHKVGTGAITLNGSPATQPGAQGAPVVTAAVVDARSVIYNGSLQMVVSDVLVTQRTIQTLARTNGGYLQELNGSALSIRVPAAKFEETLTAIERLGEVVNRHVKADDVTEALRDLVIRLENAENTRKRLQELLARSEKMEDTIRLEQELERVTQTIELCKGKLQYLRDQVAFSTIHVALNSTKPIVNQSVSMPFAWVRALGDGAVAGITEPSPDTSRVWQRNDRFKLPPGFVRYFERDYITEAMSADDVVIRLRREDNYDGGDVAFWMKLARRSLVENRAIAITREADVKVKNDGTGKLVTGVKDLGARQEGYLLGMVTTKRYVYAFEAWGPKDKVDQQAAALEAAFETLDVKHW